MQAENGKTLIISDPRTIVRRLVKQLPFYQRRCHKLRVIYFATNNTTLRQNENNCKDIEYKQMLQNDTTRNTYARKQRNVQSPTVIASVIT